jgi:hypothetical protein
MQVAEGINRLPMNHATQSGAIRMNDLNLPTVPPHVYMQVDRALELNELNSLVKRNEAIRIANGLAYSRAFSPWLSDWRASESQLLHSLDSQIDPFPGLKALRAGYKRQARIPGILSVWDALEYQEYQIRFKAKLEEYEAWVPPEKFGLGDSFDLLIGANELIIYNPHDYNAVGTSQWYREKLTALAGYAFVMLRESTFQLEQLAHAEGFTFYLRPMYAMHSAMSKDIRAQMVKGGISSAYSYLSTGQRAIWDRFKVNGISLFTDVDMSPTQYSREYWDWYYRASYMYLEHNDSDLEIHFGPWNLPPTFLSRPTDSAPYYCAESRSTFHVRHNIHFLDRFYPEYQRVEPMHDISQTILVMSDLMPVISACLTLISLSTQTGQGQYKPIWTDSPFSKGMLKLFPYACAQAIQTARNLP